MMNSTALPELLTPEQAAKAIGVTKGTLAVWRSTGRYNLAFVKAGRAVRYRLQDLEAFLERRTRHPRKEDRAGQQDAA